MQLTVFGASGRTGGCIVTQALERGHRVTAFVRDASSLPVRHPQLDVIVGDITDAVDVKRVVNGQDVVLLALGAKLNSHEQVRTQTTLNIVPAMQEFGVKRLINVSGIGTSESRSNLGRIGIAIANGMRALDRDAFEDKETQDSLIRNSDLEWINVCPPRLTQGPRTGVYRAGVDLRPSPLSRISRADVADFMLNQLIDATFVRKSPILFY
jgi:putative NADH-flavin reductase